jgi:hypothetical protein
MLVMRNIYSIMHQICIFVKNVFRTHCLIILIGHSIFRHVAYIVLNLSWALDKMFYIHDLLQLSGYLC